MCFTTIIVRHIGKVVVVELRQSTINENYFYLTSGLTIEWWPAFAGVQTRWAKLRSRSLQRQRRAASGGRRGRTSSPQDSIAWPSAGASRPRPTRRTGPKWRTRLPRTDFKLNFWIFFYILLLERESDHLSNLKYSKSSSNVPGATKQNKNKILKPVVTFEYISRPSCWIFFK
jgi:hypothetical protein